MEKPTLPAKATAELKVDRLDHLRAALELPSAPLTRKLEKSEGNTTTMVLTSAGLEYLGMLARIGANIPTITERFGVSERWLRGQGHSMPDQLLLAEFLRQLRESAAAASPRLSNGDFELQRYRNRIYLLPQFTQSVAASGDKEGVSLTIAEEYSLPGSGKLTLVPAAAVGLRLNAQDRLSVRWREGGERCRPMGRAYSARLKKLLQEFLVPPWWRERVPLLYLDDELLAVAGLWLCESSRLQSPDEDGTELWEPCWERKPLAFD